MIIVVTVKNKQPLGLELIIHHFFKEYGILMLHLKEMKRIFTEKELRGLLS